jgi:predicted RNase H-like HicB family nuclease
MNSELIFVVEESPEGGFSARALGESIFTDADSLEELRANIKDAVACHFEENMLPRLIRLHFVKEEIFAL